MMRILEDGEGFTLVEMLVSLALLALMADYGVTSLQTMRQLRDIGARIESQNEVEAVVRRLRSDLQGARPEFTNLGSSDQKLLFEGTEQTLTYVTNSNGEREVGGLYVVKLGVNGRHELQMERQLLRTDNSTPIEAVNLLRNVKEIKIGYLPATEQSSANETFVTSWEKQDHLPAAVKISSIFNAGDGRRWETQVIDLKLSN